MNMHLTCYYLRIYSKLPCSWRLKRKLLAQIKNSIRTYLQSHPHADMAEIRNQFGSPEEIAEACLAEMNQKELLKDLKLMNRIVRVITAGVLAVVLMLGATLGFLIWDANREPTDIIYVNAKDPTTSTEG